MKCYSGHNDNVKVDAIAAVEVGGAIVGFSLLTFLAATSARFKIAIFPSFEGIGTGCAFLVFCAALLFDSFLYQI